MKNSIQLIVACGILLAGTAFSQSGAPILYSGGPTSGTGSGGTVVRIDVSAPTTSTGVLVVPTTPVITTNTPTAPIVNRAPQQIVPVRIQPIVQKPDMTAILRDQAGNVQALRGINGSGKPEFQPNGTGGMTRKPAVDPKPTLGSFQMMDLGVGEISLGGLKSRTGSIRYETRTVTRPIAMGKVQSVTEEEFDMEKSFSESAINDLLTTPSVYSAESEVRPKDLILDEDVRGKLFENVGDELSEVEDVNGGSPVGRDNRLMDDFHDDFGGMVGRYRLGNGFFAGITEQRNNGGFTLDGLNDQRFGWSGAANDLFARNGGHGDVMDEKENMYYSSWNTPDGGQGHIYYINRSFYEGTQGKAFSSLAAAQEHSLNQNHSGGKVLIVIVEGKANDRSERNKYGAEATVDQYEYLKTKKAAVDAAEVAEVAAAEAAETEEEAKARKEREAEAERQRKYDEDNIEDGRTVLGGDENGQLGKGPAWARNQQRERSLIGSKATNGAGNTIRMGENGEQAGRGPLEKDPTANQKPTLRMDPERIGEGVGNLELLESKLNDPTLRFGGETGSDPRNDPRPTPGGGTSGGGPVVSPGVVVDEEVNFNNPTAQTGSGTVGELKTKVKSAVQNIQLNQNLNTGKD